MQLSVQLLEARNLTVQRHRPHLSHSGGRHARCPPRAYAIIKAGSSACKSSISASTHPSSPNSSAIEAPRDGLPHPYKGFRLHSNPYLADFAWFQEFIFELADDDDLAAEIQISVWNLHDRFSGADMFLGRFHVPMSMVRNGVNRGMANIPPAWYPLQKCHSKGSAGTPVTGEICVGFSLHGKISEPPASIPLCDVSTNSPSVEKTPESVTVSRSFSSDSLKSLDRTTSQNESHDISSASVNNIGESADSEISQEKKVHNSGSSAKNIAKNISSLISNKVLRRMSLLKESNKGVDTTSDHGVKESSNTIQEVVRTSDDKESSSGAIKEVVSNANFEGTYNASENDMKLIPISFFNDDDDDDDANGDDACINALNEVPPPLNGGILIEDTYEVRAKTMNKILFEPGSRFRKELSEVQKTADFVEGPWIKGELELPKRVVTYCKPATKLVKASNVVEDHMYTRADRKAFVINVSASTPDVPYGKTFRTDIQFCIFSGKIRKTTYFRVSWNVFFLKHSMMRGIIESGARQGLQESYNEFMEVLARYAKPLKPLRSMVDSSAGAKASVIESGVQDRQEVGLQKLDARNMLHVALEYLYDLRVCVMLLLVLIILVMHMYVPKLGKTNTWFDKWKVKFPCTFCDFIISALVGAQLEYMIRRARKLWSAKIYRGSDHGVKAKGAGWILTVTLVEAQNVPACDEVGVPDPYVVFTSTGQSRISSIKLKNFNPVWEERFEFDAIEEAPSTMSIKIFDFEGPFSESESVGYAEVNFLKQTREQLADLWVPLEGKNARAAGCKIHLRVVLINTAESKNAEDYIQKVEKEVGRKITGQSFVKNTSFQRLFSLPSEEFLVDDFSCSLRRKFLLQGRLFLSPRVLAFYSNIFGHRTRFVILWEDVDEIKEASHSFGSVGVLLNRSILVFTKKGRASDAQHGAKSMDEKGRFKFQFLSIIHYKPALRTMMVLWNYRTLSPEQRMQMIANVELQGDAGAQYRQSDQPEIFLGVDEANLTEVYEIELPFPISSILSMDEKENLEERVAQKTGRLDYFATPWERSDEDRVAKQVDGDGEKTATEQRRVTYRLSNRISLFATNVTCLQQKTSRDDGHALFIDELLTLHDVPFGNNFQIQVRKEIEDNAPSGLPSSSYCRVLMGVAWHKSSMLQSQISKNIFERYTKHLKESIDVMVREVLKK